MTSRKASKCYEILCKELGFILQYATPRLRKEAREVIRWLYKETRKQRKRSVPQRFK